MLFLIYKANHEELSYRGGQSLIVHLEADLRATVAWAEQQGKRWAFTLSNAGAYYFEDRCDLSQLNEVDWNAVQARQWSGNKEGKQAEFLLQGAFPWSLVERIGVHTRQTYQQVMNALPVAGHRPPVEIKEDWYY
jgi:hypothetical protein